MQETKKHKIYKERTRQVKWKTIIMTVQQILRFDKIIDSETAPNGVLKNETVITRKKQKNNKN